MIDRQECYVVLGHLMSANGTLGSESQLRVRKLLECVKDKKHQLIFFCGWDYRDDSDIKLAQALNDFFFKHNKEPHKIYLSDLSRDTVGDAVFLKYHFDNLLKERTINLITSDYHATRAKKIFDFVFSKNSIVLQTAKIEEKEDNMMHEIESIKVFEETFRGVAPGNIKEIYRRLISSHPYYNGTVHSRIE